MYLVHSVDTFEAHCHNLGVFSKFPIGPRWCYIHRDGVEECKRGTLLHFQEYEGRLPAEVYQTSKFYELCMKKDAVSFCCSRIDF